MLISMNCEFDKLIKFLIALLLSTMFQINAYAIDAGTTGIVRATSLNSSGTSDTIVGNATGTTNINGASVNANTQSGTSYGASTVAPTDIFTGASTQSGGTYSENSYINTTQSAIDIASSGRVTMASAVVAPSGNINGTSLVTVTPTSATIVSSGNSSYTAMGWGPTGSSSISDYTNYIQANSSGVAIASATALTLNATTTTITSTTNNLVGTTNINTTGNASTSIGNVGTGSVSLTSGTNSLVVSNSGAAITGPVAISGNTSVGGTLSVVGATTTNGITNTGSFQSIGNATIGSGSASSITLGNSTGNSTISMNGNQIHNVANGTAATDAVNYSQLSSVTNSISSLNNSVNNLSNQLQQSQTQYRSGIAGVAAMNGIGALNGNQKVNFGIGVGGFAGQAGIAAGGNVRITDSTTFKASVAQTNQNTVVSGGLTIGF